MNRVMEGQSFLDDRAAAALAVMQKRPQAPLIRFQLLSGADLCNATPMRWMVRGVLPAERFAALYGQSGSGKSFLVLDMAFTVASGDIEWFGRSVIQAQVTYVCLEGEAGMGKRVKAWSLHHNKPVPDALRFIMQPFDLRSNDVPGLAEAIVASGGEGGLVIVDTLSRAAPGADENSSVDMGKIIAAAKQLQILVGGLVLLVHHTGKDATRGLRGHSSLYAALDGAIEVTATDTRRAWSVAKSKDDVTGDAHPFKLKIVTVDIDDEGNEITSCVAVAEDAGAPNTAKGKSTGKKLSTGAQIARDTLSWAIQNQGIDPPPEVIKETGGGNLAIAGNKVVSVAAWRERFCLTHGAESADTKRKAFDRQITCLQSNGMVRVLNSYAWVPLVDCIP